MPSSTLFIRHGGGWLYISDTVCGRVSGPVYLRHSTIQCKFYYNFFGCLSVFLEKTQTVGGCLSPSAGLLAAPHNGLLSSASYPVMFEGFPSVMKIFQPWEHLTCTHCESHGDSLFLSVAHISLTAGTPEG